MRNAFVEIVFGGLCTITAMFHVCYIIRIELHVLVIKVVSSLLVSEFFGDLVRYFG